MCVISDTGVGIYMPNGSIINNYLIFSFKLFFAKKFTTTKNNNKKRSEKYAVSPRIPIRIILNDMCFFYIFT